MSKNGINPTTDLKKMLMAGNNALPETELTIGVEIEFVLVADTSRVRDWGPSALFKVHECIHEACPDIPLNPIDLEEYHTDPDIDTFYQFSEAAAYHEYNENFADEGFDAWTVSWDTTVGLTEAEAAHGDLVEHSVELITPVFDYNEDDWANEIARVLRSLHQRFSGESPFRMIVNKTSGLHVHVGKRGGKHSLETVKNLMMLGIAFERIFDQFHDTSRICSYRSHEQSSCFPPSFYRFFQDDTTSMDSMVWCERIASIQIADQIDDRLFDLNKSVTINIMNWLETQGSKDTIEFRQHAGTLDAVQISAWVRFVSTLMRFADEFNTAAVYELLRLRGRDLTFYARFDFLKAIGADEALTMHYRHFQIPGAATFRAMAALAKEPIDSAFYSLIRQVEKDKCLRNERGAIISTVLEKVEEDVYGIYETPMP